MSVTLGAQAGSILGSTCAAGGLFVAARRRRSAGGDGFCAGVASISSTNRHVADATY